MNDPTDDPLPGRAEKQPRTFPSVVPSADGGLPRVHFVWPDAAPPDDIRAALADVVARLTYLGSSRSPVAVGLTDDPLATNWVPDPDGDVVLRVTGPGRLDDLEWHFQQGLRPPPGGTHPYRLAAPLGQGVARGAFGEVFVYRLDGPVGLELETTLKVTAALRAAVMSRAGDLLGEVPATLSGHAADGSRLDRPHAAYLPLPFVSPTQPHADGHLLGVAVALPEDTPVDERRRAGRVLADLDHVTVRGVGRFGLNRLGPADRAPLNLRPEEWSRPSRLWASATPVVLDRFPRRDGRDAGAVVAAACRNVGLPSPDEVALSRHSVLFGVPPSGCFVTRRPGPGRSDVPRPYTHLTLRFASPVAGPVLLGAGRYFGLGLLRPLPDPGP